MIQFAVESSPTFNCQVNGFVSNMDQDIAEDKMYNRTKCSLSMIYWLRRYKEGDREREKSKRASTKSSQTLQQLLPHAGLTERKMVTQRNTQERVTIRIEECHPEDIVLMCGRVPIYTP